MAQTNVQAFSGDVAISSNLAVDTNTLFVDSVGNKVGIGTASPIEDLHIQADASPQILVEDTGVANQASIRFKTGVTDWAVGQHGATNVGDFKISNYTELGTNDRIIIDTIGDVAISSNLAVDTNTLFVDSVGNKVGIGMTNPQATLDVAGSSSSGKSLQLRSGDQGTSTDSSQIIFSYSNNPYNSSGYAHSLRTRHNGGADTRNAIDFWLWNTTDTTNESTLGNKRVMTIEGNGRVGIGTDAPQATLDVVGDVAISSNLAVDTNTLFVDSVGNKVGIGTASPTELLDITAASGDYNAFIRLRSGSGGTDPVTESGLKLTEIGEYGFQFAHSGATDLLKIRHQNSDGNVDLDNIMVWHPNGKVGIGTNDPDSRLHIEEPTSIGATTTLFHTEIGFAGGSRGHFEIKEEKHGAGTGWSDFNLRLQRRIDTTVQGYMDFNPSNGTGGDYGIAFGTGSTELMRISNDGKVGIGTPSPQYPLSFYRAGFGVKSVVVNPMSGEGAGSFNFGTLFVGDNVVTECICIYNPTVEGDYGFKCGYVQWIQMKVRGEGIGNTIQIIKFFSSDSSTVTITESSGSSILNVSSGTADISYTARVFYRSLDTP